MNSIFEPASRDELLHRLNRLTSGATPLWGKMRVDQMLHHLNLSMEAALGKVILKGKYRFFMRPFIGVLYNDKPFGMGRPTPRDFVVQDDYDFHLELEKATQNLQEISKRAFSDSFQPHVFFGPLSNEQWGKHFYKHTDHHLRQFGC